MARHATACLAGQTPPPLPYPCTCPRPSPCPCPCPRPCPCLCSFPGFLLGFWRAGEFAPTCTHARIHISTSPLIPQAVTELAPLDPATPSGSQFSIVSAWSRRIEFSACDFAVGGTGVVGSGPVWFSCAGSRCIVLDSTAGACSF